MDIIGALEKLAEWKVVKAQAARVPLLEARIAQLENRLGMSNTATVVCDHCGSPDLVRTGSRPNPTFGVMGAKDARYRCNGCGQETYVIID